MIVINEQTCTDFEAVRNLEWLETNGLGGFASSTLSGLNTRRYHGLLVAATKPPVGRVVLLSRIDETLVLGDDRVELGTAQYPGTVHPAGYRLMKEFRLQPFPTAVFEAGGLVIEKAVFMVHGENTTIIEYSIKGGVGSIPTGTLLELQPLIAFRDYHSLTHENSYIDSSVETSAGSTRVQAYPDQPSLWFIHDADVGSRGYWYRRFEYSAEKARGLDFQEDLFNPFSLQVDLSRTAQFSILVSTDPRNRTAADIPELRAREIDRRKAIVDSFASTEPLAQAMASAADQFIVARGSEKTIIAGYHWFSDWGRDTMISLPGLVMATGRDDVARSILLTFASHVDRGMLPNRFPDDAEDAVEYNTVDATLWYFESVRRLLQQTGDLDWVRDNLYEILVEIIEWHIRGTRFNIQVDSDGLLHAGAPGVQLTWMDAKVGDWVVTPRLGKPVEIQALWYNALVFMSELAGELGHRDVCRRYSQMARKAKRSFSEVFWNEDAGCLFDVINEGYRDASIRPNQVFAISLKHSMLTRERSRKVIDVVERELLTPYGLRSLSSADPAYRGRYGGAPLERDGAYHQGTVWAWLMGPFITAYLNAYGRNKKTRSKVDEWLKPFEQHLSQAGLGHVSEVFDGDSPFHSGGCIAQAWSVGELLRILVEERSVKLRGIRN